MKCDYLSTNARINSKAKMSRKLVPLYFHFDTLLEMGQHKTPIKNLYLTGASTHPGGGVFAASGYNTAKVVLKDVKGKWF